MADKPISPVDKKAIHKSIVDLENQLNALLPHINTATTAFGDEANLQSRATDLRNKLAAAKAAYAA